MWNVRESAHEKEWCAVTIDDLKHAMVKLGYGPGGKSNKAFAELVGVRERVVYYWLAGTLTMSKPTEKLIERLAE